jgi:hypothetical protein
MALGDVVTDRKRCPAHLHGKTVLFLGRELLQELVNLLAERAAMLI